MQTIQTGREKQLVYAHEYRRLKKALQEGFYLEAIVISYAIIEDRLVAFFHHAGIVSRQIDTLAINRPIYPYMRELMGLDKDASIRIKDVSVKMDLIRKLLSMTEDRAAQIDDDVALAADSRKKKAALRKSYMVSLQRQIDKTIDREAVLEILDRLEPWRNERNQLIHALLNKTATSSEAAREECACTGQELARGIDDTLVKPIKKNNRLRRQHNIQ